MLTIEQQKNLFDAEAKIIENGNDTGRTIPALIIVQYSIKNKAVQIHQSEVLGSETYKAKMNSLANRCIQNQGRITNTAMEMFLSIAAKSNESKYQYGNIFNWNQSQWTLNFEDVVTDVFEIVAGVLPEDKA